MTNAMLIADPAHHEFGNGKPNRSHQPGLHQLVTFNAAPPTTTDAKPARHRKVFRALSRGGKR